MASSNIAARELLAAIRAATGGPPDPVPPGWRTAQGWADYLNVSRAMAGQYISRLGELAQRKDFRIETGAGVRSVPHYLLNLGTRRCMPLKKREAAASSPPSRKRRTRSHG